MKMLITWFAIEGTKSYPDKAKYFEFLEEVTWNGVKYYYTDYAGVKNLEVGDVAAYEASLKESDIINTGVRVLSTSALFDRLTVVERHKIRLLVNSPDFTKQSHIEIVDYYEELKYFKDYVYLDVGRLIPFLDFLVIENILLEGRQATLLVDAQPYEVVTLNEELLRGTIPKS